MYNDKLCPSGSAPAHIYDTPEMPKFSSSDSFPKLCLIVSSIGTFNYNLAYYLRDLLSPLVPNDYSCKDTFSLVSNNVINLFSNIPLQQTIDIVINLIFSHNPNLNITKKNLKNFSFLLHHRFIFFLMVNFIIKLME